MIECLYTAKNYRNYRLLTWGRETKIHGGVKHICWPKFFVQTKQAHDAFQIGILIFEIMIKPEETTVHTV